ncbi:MAG TPA: hypothetical protein VHF22_03410 [Planctomycetota bacterium]|nr:hypothetical protein [Planctomycetota bacterium]
MKRLLERYRSLGAAPELELFETLYRCLLLDEKLKTGDGRGGAK